LDLRNGGERRARAGAPRESDSEFFAKCYKLLIARRKWREIRICARRGVDASVDEREKP